MEVCCLPLCRQKGEHFLLMMLDVVSCGCQPHFKDVDCFELVALQVFSIILLLEIVAIPLLTTSSFYLVAVDNSKGI